MYTHNQKTAARNLAARSALLKKAPPLASLPTSNRTGTMTVRVVGFNDPSQTADAYNRSQYLLVRDYFSLGMAGLVDASTGVNTVYDIMIRPVQVSPLLTPAEMLNTVRDTFNLNVSDAARVFCVTRPTIYQWATLDDISQIRARSVLKRMQELYALAIEWKSMGDGLTGRWERMPLRTCLGQSVIDLLSAGLINHQAVLGAHAQLKAAAALLRQAEIDRSVKAVESLGNAFARMEESMQGRERGRP